MIKFFKALLSDVGTVSMTRFLSLICVLAAIFISIFTLYKDLSADTAVGLVSVFLASAFGGKVVQKFAEVKSESSKSEISSGESNEEK